MVFRYSWRSATGGCTVVPNTSFHHWPVFLWLQMKILTLPYLPSLCEHESYLLLLSDLDLSPAENFYSMQCVSIVFRELRPLQMPIFHSGVPVL